AAQADVGERLTALLGEVGDRVIGLEDPPHLAGDAWLHRAEPRARSHSGWPTNPPNWLKRTSAPAETTTDRTHERATPEKSGRRKATGLTGRSSPRQPGHRMGTACPPWAAPRPHGGTRKCRYALVFAPCSSCSPSAPRSSASPDLRLPPATRGTTSPRSMRSVPAAAWARCLSTDTSPPSPSRGPSTWRPTGPWSTTRTWAARSVAGAPWART